jgi:hypothetical protein
MGLVPPYFFSPMTTNTYNSTTDLPFGLRQDEGQFASLLYTGSKSYSGKMARQLMKDPEIKKWIDDGRTYSKKRKTNVEQFLYNLIEVRRTQLLINDTKDFNHLTVRLAVPLRDIKRLHKYLAQHMSYEYIREIIERMRDAGYIHHQYGTQRYVPEIDGGQVTRIGITNKFEDLCDQYLNPSSPFKHGVEYHVCSDTIHMKDRGGKLVKYKDADFPIFKEMRSKLSDYNRRMSARSVTLWIPISDVCLSSSLDHFVLSHQNTTEIESSGSNNHDNLPLSSSSPSLPLHYCSNINSQKIQSRIRDLENKARILIHITPKARDGCLVYELDDYHLHTKRTFCRSSTTHGGRHYAPIQNIPSKWRKHLRIDDEPVVELDYDGLHVSMLYHKEGTELTFGDAYEIDAFPEIPRKTLKPMTLILINSRSSQSYYTRIKSDVTRGSLDLGPYGVGDVKAITHAIRGKHDPIRDYFWSDSGVKLQYADSKIASHIMSEMDVIPIHDGFVCRASEEERLKTLMKEAYKEVMGDYEIGISREFTPLTETITPRKE